MEQRSISVTVKTDIIDRKTLSATITLTDKDGLIAPTESHRVILIDRRTQVDLESLKESVIVPFGSVAGEEEDDNQAHYAAALEWLINYINRTDLHKLQVLFITSSPDQSDEGRTQELLRDLNELISTREIASLISVIDFSTNDLALEQIVKVGSISGRYHLATKDQDVSEQLNKWNETSVKGVFVSIVGHPYFLSQNGNNDYRRQVIIETEDSYQYSSDLEKSKDVNVPSQEGQKIDVLVNSRDGVRGSYTSEQAEIAISRVQYEVSKLDFSKLTVQEALLSLRDVQYLAYSRAYSDISDQAIKDHYRATIEHVHSLSQLIGSITPINGPLSREQQADVFELISNHNGDLSHTKQEQKPMQEEIDEQKVEVRSEQNELAREEDNPEIESQHSEKKESQREEIPDYKQLDRDYELRRELDRLNFEREQRLRRYEEEERCYRLKLELEKCYRENYYRHCYPCTSYCRHACYPYTYCRHYCC